MNAAPVRVRFAGRKLLPTVSERSYRKQPKVGRRPTARSLARQNCETSAWVDVFQRRAIAFVPDQRWPSVCSDGFALLKPGAGEHPVLGTLHDVATDLPWSIPPAAAMPITHARQ